MPEPTSTAESNDQAASNRPDPLWSRARPSGRWLLRLILVTVVLASTTGVAMADGGPDRRDSGFAPERLLFRPEPAALGSSPNLPVRPRPPTGLVDGLWLDTDDRGAVTAAYVDAFGTPTPELTWSGAHSRCEPGDSSDNLRRATLERVAFYRAMAGVPASVVEDPEHSQLAQAAALMMSAEGALTHHPEPDYACFSADGQLAAANSNLYLGRTGPQAIDGYIEDPGDRNRDVGHRSTILHPPTRTMGVGHVAAADDRHAANVLWVFDDRVFADDVRTREPDGFVAWPPRGYIPAPIVYPRWSFALAEADFDDARVTMEVDGRVIEPDVVTRQSKVGEVPSSIVVWEPDPDTISSLVLQPLTDGTVDEVTVSVTIRHVGLPRDGSWSSSEMTLDFSYDVIVLAPPESDGSPLDRALAPISRAALAFLDVGLPTGP